MKILDQRMIDVYILQFGDDGIFRAHVRDNDEQTLDGLKEALVVMGEMVNYKKVPMLSTFDAFTSPNKELRAFAAKADNFQYVSAEALVLDSIALKIIGNFFLKIDKPDRPIKIFTNKEDAIQWLKTFL